MSTTETPEQMLREFHASKVIHGGLMPTAPTADIPAWVQMLRMDMLDEEVSELHEAVEKGDVVKIADAIADITYVTVGTAVAYGIPFDAVFAEVHRSNMTKVNTPAEAKLVKGPGYEPPNIAGVLGVDDDPRHIAISVYGWNCDVCGRPVDGRTDERGVSCRRDGMPVMHVKEDEDETAQRADDEAWANARGE